MRTEDVDPVRARRARIAAAARLGQRLGYGLFACSLGLLVVGFATTFTPLLVGITTACLIGGSIVLAPSIVAGYAARAAEREDRERGL
jgi:ABC-type nickel/cobalt efflux system permease component RcnA